MTDRCAVIVDGRKIDYGIIRRHLELLTPEWEVKIINHLTPNSLEGYNRLLTSRSFWEPLCENVLIFQQDSMLLRKGINDFVGKWDYIGAPWAFQEFGGNGGLSLRKRGAMLRVIDCSTWNGENEDIYFCNNMHEMGMNLAPGEECAKFSVEAVFAIGTLGYHGIDNWLTGEQCEQIRGQYL